MSQSPLLLEGDCKEVLKTLAPDSIEAAVSDPPYGLGDMSPARVAECLAAWTRGEEYQPTGAGFMGKAWDAWTPGPDMWRELYRVLKPGAHALIFAGSRTQDIMSIALRLAGFEVRDTLQWLYSSGTMSKSHDISKAIDKQRYDRDQIREVTAWIRAKRDARGLRNADIDAAFGFNGTAGHWTAPASQPRAPTLDQVPKLLKVLGVAPEELPPRIAYLLEHLNTPKGQPAKTWHLREVIGARVAGPHWGEAFAHAKSKTSPHLQDITAPATDAARAWDGWGTALRPAYEPIILARKPLDGTAAQNTLTHGCGGLNIDGCRVGGEVMTARAMSSLGVMHDDKWTSKPIPPTEKEGRFPRNILLDEAAAELLDAQTGEPTSRFFYCAKASRAEREAGLDGHGTRANTHPTVKPIELMRYLVRLITPPGASVIDPFMGSGSTGCAAVLEGARFVGIEREAEYMNIARARIAHHTPAPPSPAPPSPADEQLSLFDTDTGTQEP